MSEEMRVGDRVEIFLSARTWGVEGWFAGTVLRIDPYSAHRSFYWVELDDDGMQGGSGRLISVLNPKNIRKHQEI